MDQNACSVCGFTTADFAEFTRHVEKHERDTNNDNHGNVNNNNNNGRDAGNKSKAASAGKKLREELRRLRHSQQRRQQTATATAAIMDLQQPNSEEQQEAAESANHSATMLGHLADLSRFLTAATCPDGNGTSEEPVDEEEANEDEDQAMVTHSASPLSPTDQSAPEDSFDQTMEEEEEDDPQQQQKRSSHSGGKKGKGGGKTTHRCPHCTFTTYMSQHMKSHLRAHDNFVGQMYICDVCGMAFSQKANMHRHRGTHSGVKPYECRFCQKKFFRKDQMQEHSMTHIKTGDDFDCPVSGCECKFSQHSMLRQHLDQKHAISSSQQAHCKRCTLQFSNSRRLLLHYQTKHDEYYSSISPVPEGQSPVKRLLNGQQPQNDSSNPPSVGASPPKTRRSRKRPRTSTAAGVLAKPSKKPNISTSPMVAAPSNGVGGYKVEELLRLDCGATNNRSSCPSASASVSPAITVEDPQLQQQHHNSAALFAMSSPSKSSSASPVTAAGLDHIFRDHLLFRHSLAAAQQAGGGGEMGNVLFPLPGQKAQSKSQQQQEAAAAAIASAAAAQLFMQSVWMATNSSSSGATKTSTPTMAPSICGSNIRQHRAAEITSNEEDEPKHRHLPLAKSPDCRGLMLNGFKTSTATARAGKQPKRESKAESQASTANTGREETFDDGMEEAKQRKGTTTSPSTAGTCSTRCQQQHHEASVEQKRQQRLPDNSTMTPALEMEASETTQLLSAAAAAPSSAHQQPTTATAAASAHSSTTHSPSSSSTASSSCVDGSGSGSATSSTLGLDNSPLKVLNGKLLTSSGLLSRALTASEGLLKEALNQSGEMDCTHCGLLFTDQTLYLLHKGLHSEADPWRCNLCGQNCSDKYTFTTHMISSDHS